MGMSVDKDGNQVIEAEVPIGEMGTYAIDLRSMTQGRGSFTLDFIRYDEAPADRPAEDHRGRQEAGRGRAVIQQQKQCGGLDSVRRRSMRKTP
jgi:translation elongation factor EF-G